MYKAVIFDLDGTIVNTLDDLMQAINLALEIKGYPFRYDLEGTKKLIGQGTKVLCQRAIAPLNPTQEMWMDLFKEFSKQYNIHQLDHAYLYPHTLETLSKLKQKGIKTAILSNKVDANTKHIIDTLCPKDTFDYVLGQLENMPLKPDPTGLNKVIQGFNLDKNEILYVGDSDTDMKTGMAAKVDICAVTYGFRDKEILMQYYPKYMVDSIEEILKII